MGRPCAVCISPKREEIDMAIASGVRNKTIAATAGLTPGQISRHKRRCLAPLSEADQVQLWLSRAEELWNLAGVNGDLRGQATALQQGLKSLEFSIRHRAEEEQRNDSRTLPENLDQWTESERTKMLAFLDHIILNTALPTAPPPKVPVP